MTHDRICRSPATDDQDCRVDLWCWAERVTWQGSPGLHVPPRVRLACPWRVTAPWPAPMSMTSSPGRRSASATVRPAHSSTSGCQPHARRDRPMPDTANHEDRHAPTVGEQHKPRQPSFRRVPTVAPLSCADHEPSASAAVSARVATQAIPGGRPDLSEDRSVGAAGVTSHVTRTHVHRSRCGDPERSPQTCEIAARSRGRRVMWARHVRQGLR
jgi:hypothetical protein